MSKKDGPTADSPSPRLPASPSAVSDAPASATAETIPEPQRAPRMQRVWAAQCPAGEKHHTRVYKTEGKVRYCACDDCGATWKQPGAYADPLTDFGDSLIRLLETTPSVVVEPDRPPVILIEAADAKALAWKLRELLGLKAPKPAAPKAIGENKPAA